MLTRSCDLAHGKADTVLVATAHDAQRLVDQGVLKAAVIRDQVRRHLAFGWYFIRASTPPIALPEMLVELRDLHWVPRVILEQLIAAGKRVAIGPQPA